MTLHQRLKRAICCPDGCCSPADCYANGHRDVPVKLDAAAKAVGAVIREAWAAQNGHAVSRPVESPPEAFGAGGR